jgi:hypothetical protein
MKGEEGRGGDVEDPLRRPGPLSETLDPPLMDLIGLLTIRAVEDSQYCLFGCMAEILTDAYPVKESISPQPLAMQFREWTAPVFIIDPRRPGGTGTSQGNRPTTD